MSGASAPKSLYKQRSDTQLLSDLYLSEFHARGIPEGGNAELWLRVLFNFLDVRGFITLAPSLQDKEQEIMDAGLSKQYIGALMDVCSGQLAAAGDEAAKMVLLLSSTSEERLRAIGQITAGLKR